MDRKNPLLLIMMITLLGIAIAGAIWTFGQRNVQVRRDAIISHVQHVAADAFQYRLRPRTLGGGGGSYEGYAIPSRLRSTALAQFSVGEASTAQSLVVVARGERGIGDITAGVDSTGAVSILTLTGDLAY